MSMSTVTSNTSPPAFHCLLVNLNSPERVPADAGCANLCKVSAALNSLSCTLELTLCTMRLITKTSSLVRLKRSKKVGELCAKLKIHNKTLPTINTLCVENSAVPL
ncbi:hypothetical protein J6590_091020 [Homalodisca vitripennis]|nr:hypothetical protein J6590_091020 [Homalodisca vitripennis]